MADLSALEVRSSQAWRTWLPDHHFSSAGIWLVFRKGRPRYARRPAIPALPAYIAQAHLREPVALLRAGKELGLK